MRIMPDYSLNRQHEAGKHKARVFEAALGISSDDAGWLREQLLSAVLEEEVFEGRPSPFGKKYIMDITISHSGRAASVRSTGSSKMERTFPG